MELLGLIFFKFLYAFVSGVSIMIGIYCHKYKKDKLVKFLKYLCYSLAWTCGYWAIFKLFSSDEGTPKAYEFIISFTPLFAVSVYHLINIRKK
jgi:hypothetical protein